MVLRKTGVALNGWRFERWRQHGLLQPGAHEHPGSAAEYDDDALAQSCLLAELSRDRRRKYNDLALLLFWRGRWVREDALRRAAVEFLDQLDRWIGPADSERDLDALARKAARLAARARRNAAGRWMKRRLRGRGRRPEEELADVYYSLLHVFKTGETTSEESLAKVVQALGLGGAYHDMVRNAGPMVTGGIGALADFLSGVTISQVLRAFDGATMDDLREARDLIQLTLPCFRALSVLYTRWWGDEGDGLGFGYLRDLKLDELTLAGVLPVALMALPYARSDGGRQFMENVRKMGPYFE
ncbi:MAG TPA: hypothetical protein VG245_04115, partial [Candidatus Dormibacteraeota bacterium]|nr:hypothetical protein [Candidatus Dormibacteraeota bacterium]